MREFVLISGEENKSTIEDIARFTVQCGEAGADDYLKLRLFANSLTKSAFTWYMNLPPNKIRELYFTMLFIFVYSAYTTTKLNKLGGSSPLVITSSEDVYVFLEKADRMRVLRPQLMSAKHLMNVGSRIVLGTPISLFNFVLSGWEREESIRTSSRARWRTLRTNRTI